jgi:hypothetical protein
MCVPSLCDPDRTRDATPVTGLISTTIELSRPIQPGDAQVQKSSLNDNLSTMLRQVQFEAKRDYPTKTFNGYQYEIVEDGAGTKHYNLTVYLCDQLPGPQLDPRNLNGSQQAIFGQYLTPEELERLGIGQKDRRA